MNSFGIPISAPTLLALRAFLQTHPSAGSMGEVVDAAINAWLGQQTGTGVGDPGLGYQWKSLFLPAGTQVRFDYGGQTYHAQVQGDHFVYKGKPTSPRGMLMAVAGLTGNAWKLLRIRRPGDKQFFMPAILRNRIEHDDPAAANSNENALVRRMVDALGRIETSLRERRDEQPRRGMASHERRQPRTRREADHHAPPAPAAGRENPAGPHWHASSGEQRLDDVPFDAPTAVIHAAEWPPIHGYTPVAGALSDMR